MSTTNKFCSTCKFLNVEGKSCHRYPTPLRGIELNHWCGEWAPSDKVSMAENSDRDKAQMMLSAWNDAIAEAPNCNLRGALELTERRTSKCIRRLAERPFEEWKIIFKICAESPFLNGLNDRRWVASFNWIIDSPDTGLKVLEGKYTPVQKKAGHYDND